jgi:single-strand DNA-binding protein
MSTTDETVAPARNVVSLAGRVSSTPVERELPSGDKVVTFRMVMAREQTAMTTKSKQVSDWVDCAAWASRVRRSVGTWQVDDHVEVEGALRRRFFKDGGGASSRVEIEILTARRLDRVR